MVAQENIEKVHEWKEDKITQNLSGNTYRDYFWGVFADPFEKKKKKKKLGGD